MPELFRYWTFVIYPDSAPNDWKEQLIKLGVPCAVSPPHNADGEHGKLHFHVLIGFNRAYSESRARSICDAVGGANGVVQCVYAPLAMYEYLTHKNDPDKEQFEGVSAESFNGFKVPKLKLDDDDMFDEVSSLVFDYNLMEFADIVKYFRDLGQSEKVTWVCKHAYGINTLLTSFRCKQTDYMIHNNPIPKDDGFRRFDGASPFGN